MRLEPKLPKFSRAKPGWLVQHEPWAKFLVTEGKKDKKGNEEETNTVNKVQEKNQNQKKIKKIKTKQKIKKIKTKKKIKKIKTKKKYKIQKQKKNTGAREVKARRKMKYQCY